MKPKFLLKVILKTMNFYILEISTFFAYYIQLKKIYKFNLLSKYKFFTLDVEELLKNRENSGHQLDTDKSEYKSK